MRLNLGCSDRHFPGFTNVDLCAPADVIADLTERWPWEDNSIEVIRAWDLIEHLPDKNFTMNEAFRVLKPGGCFDIEVPTTDGRGAWQDPGHVSFWNRNSFFYYQHGNPHLTRFAPMNGVRCAFRIVEEHERMLADQVSKLHIVLEAVKA
jgi:ubiquinone/menaquinone biosynthesis C-methylase UbiE